MKNRENNFIYDVFVVGNGIAAKHFLFELSNKFSQNKFSVGQIYNNSITPACSDHASVTISLNGIREDVSQLGDELRQGYFSFLDYVKKYKPAGVFPTERVVTCTNPLDHKKLFRRYTTLQDIPLIQIKKPYLINPLEGTSYEAYMIDVDAYLAFMDGLIKLENFDRMEGFVEEIDFQNGLYELRLKDKTLIKTKKLVLAMGAYSKIYQHFYEIFNTLKKQEIDVEINNQIKVGSYLYKEVKWNKEPLYLVIDGHKLMYYKIGEGEKEKEYLRLATVTTLGTEVACNHAEFLKIHKLYKEKTNLDIGEYESFTYDYGLRHKGPRRTVIAKEIDHEILPNLFMINSLYKNGFTLSFVATKKLLAYF